MHRRNEVRILVLIVSATIAFCSLFFAAKSDWMSEYLVRAFAPAFHSDTFFLAIVRDVKEEVVEAGGFSYPRQTIPVRILTGPAAGEEHVLHNNGALAKEFNRGLHRNEVVVVGKNTGFEGDPYYMSDRFRLPALFAILLAFVLAIILVARWRGFTSLMGLGMSALVLIGFIIPRIIHGSSPLFTILQGTFLIGTVSLYLAHGFNKRTSIAVAGTLITLVLALGLAVLCVHLGNILGLGTEDTFYLKLNLIDLNLTGFLLGGILIGALGVLDDVTIGQSATIEEIRRANPTLGITELYRRGMAVGREHIASLVNTLVLAYAGTSLPLILLFVMNQGVVPYWVIANGEQIAEEVIRTVVGSLALVLAVPITTFLAAYFFGRHHTTETH